MENIEQSEMVQVERKYLDELKEKLASYEIAMENVRVVDEVNDKAFLELTEKLERSQANYSILERLYNNSRNTIDILNLKLRLQKPWDIQLREYFNSK